jgi:tape measure domain-containing protein
VALLGFQVNQAGATQFNNTLNQLQGRAVAASVAIGTAVGTAVGNMMANIATGIGQAVAGIPVAIAQAGDKMNGSLQQIESSIGRSATSATEAADIYDKLYQIGTRTGVSADESAQAFTRFNMAMQELKRPATDTVDLIEGLQAAGIVAGVSAENLKESMVQLGQTLGSGQFQAEELNTLRDNMPRFLNDITKALGMTRKEFNEAVTKGKMTVDLFVPAMMQASAAARKELANFPIGMSRAYQILTNSAKRFLAEIDRTLGLSDKVARIFLYISHTLDSWRSGIRVVGDFVQSLGGLEAVLRIVAAAAIVLFGPSLLASVPALFSALAAGAMAFGRAVLVAFLPIVGALAWILIVEDFITWLRGGDSLFGDRFGEFSKILDGLKVKFEEFKAWFMAIPQLIADTWNEQMERMRPQFEWLAGVVEQLKVAFAPLADFFAGVFDNIIAKITQFYEKAMFVFNGVRSGVGWLMDKIGMGGGGDTSTAEGAAAGPRRGGLRSGLAIDGYRSDFDYGAFNTRIPDMSGSIGRNGAGVSQTITNQNDITVNAPGSDPASVASATQSGVNRANEANAVRLGGSFASGLGVSMPRVEAATQ